MRKQKRVVVFDIDDCLSKKEYHDKNISTTTKRHPECPMLIFSHEGSNYPHYFLPYLDVLFKYLIDHDVRIVFFSSGVEFRNIPILTELLKKLLGEDQYHAYLQKGQFEIFSKQHLRKADPEKREYCQYIKDLTQVVKADESLQDIILVEDDPSYVASDQKPCIIALDLLDWHLESIEKPDESEYHFPKNGTYYLLGFFDIYFSDPQYTYLPLRVGIEQFIQNHNIDYDKSFRPVRGVHPFVFGAIDHGLSMVRKIHPEAIFYGQERRDQYDKKSIRTYQ